MPLTDTRLRAIKPTAKLVKYSDSEGLQVWSYPNGAKLWRVAYRFDNKQKLLAVGPYPLISLSDARQARDDAKRLLLQGRDPSAVKRELKAAKAAAGDTFEAIGREYVEKLRREGRAEATLTKTEWLLNFAYPALGKKPIREITSADLLAVLRKIEARRLHESARRLRSTIGAVFKYAAATARADSDPTSLLVGALTRPTVTPRAAITNRKKFAALVRAIEAFDGYATTRAALKLMSLLYPRPGELRLAHWGEFDFEKRIWVIPASRTKIRKEHTKPLPDQAVTILQELRDISSDTSFVFPSLRSQGRALSEGTMNAAVCLLGIAKEDHSPHGFRASASTILNESGKWHPDAIERELGHVEADDVRGAYARGGALEGTSRNVSIMG